MTDRAEEVPRGKAPEIEWPLPGVTLTRMIERADPAIPRYPEPDRLYARIRGHRLMLYYRRSQSRGSLPVPQTMLVETPQGVVIRGRLGPSPRLVLAVRTAIAVGAVVGVVVSLATNAFPALIATLVFAAGFHVVTPKLWRGTPAQRRELDALRDAVVERFSSTGR